MKIGIAVRQALPAADEAAERLRGWLKKRRIQAVPFDDVVAGGAVDIVMALGGDGTFLQAASYVAPREIPVIGVNFGQVG
jgi:NAD+ kinase